MQQKLVSKKDKYYRNLFISAAIWNWLAATIAFLSNRRDPAENATPAMSQLNSQLFLSFVALFGLGYFLVSRDISKNQDIVKLGIIGKTIVFILMLRYAIAGKIPPSTLAVGFGDLVYAGLFTEFLLNSQKSK